MMNEIDFEECLKDSPTYRNQLRQATTNIDMLEDRLEQMSKSCNSVIHNGKIFVQDFQKFLKCISDVRELFSSDDLVYKSLAKFSEYLREIQLLFSSLFEQTTNSVLRTLTRMLKEDIRKVKDQGKLFDRLSSDYNIALQKNADASKMKPHVCEDASKILIATRSCFGHTSIDYTYQINVLFNQHKVELIELLLSYINIHKAFFHQGHELLSIDTDGDFDRISSQLTKMRQDNTLKQKNLEKIHDINQRRCNLDDNRSEETSKENLLLTVPKENLPRNASQQSLSNGNNLTATATETTKEGYLFKRSHNKFKTWSRRWFTLRHGQLLYMKRQNGSATNDSLAQHQSTMVADLRLCTIRPVNDNDRRFVFEILSPNSSHLLQADSQLQCDQWVNALQIAITNSFKSPNGNIHNSASSSPKSSGDDSTRTQSTEKMELKHKMIKEKIDYVRSMPGNEKCCDCDADGPEWASINLGILLCLNCGGAHRGLGVSLSKVRSLHMDTWDLETLMVMSDLGNKLVNEIYEAKISNGMNKPTADTDAVTRRAFIEAKYVQKAFLKALPTASQMGSLSIRSIKRWSVTKNSNGSNNEIDDEISKANTNGSLTSKSKSIEPDTHSDDINPSEWNTNIYLYESARQGHVPMMLHALALGADKNYTNEHDQGRTPLIQAILSRSVPAAEFLLTNNAKVNLADQNGKIPLHYATQLTQKGRGPIMLLLKRGADPLLKDNNGVDACSLSMDIGDPDVITWYRLVALHEQMKEEDADAEKTYISILDDPVYMQEIARTPSLA